jgi:hypothetical protein
MAKVATTSSDMRRSYNPSGLLAVPLRGVVPQCDAVFALAPAWVPGRPSGFLFVLPLGPVAPVTSLM